ncbi:MAG: 4-(cytidine 5'-diphospho)-2-C-methyl-D-erythritol kinase [Ghiorsea sp.]
MSVIYAAPAKVNLHLVVTAVRDDGYHALDTSFVYVDVGDELHIEAADTLLVRCSNPAFDGEQNLVHQVLSAFRDLHDVKQGLSVFIDKHLPAQAGLGGGSSDAATALLVANEMWGVGCSVDQLIQFATPFGADIPCFLFQQASEAVGIGEKLKPYNYAIPEGCVVLAWPGEGVSTVAAFQYYDQQKIEVLTKGEGVAKLRVRSQDNAFEIGINDLEQSAVALCSPLAKLLKVMRLKSDRAWMSGSGSACVAVCETLEQADELIAALSKQALASWTHVGHFVQHHPYSVNEKIGA